MDITSTKEWKNRNVFYISQQGKVGMFPYQECIEKFREKGEYDHVSLDGMDRFNKGYSLGMFYQIGDSGKVNKPATTILKYIKYPMGSGLMNSYDFPGDVILYNDTVAVDNQLWKDIKEEVALRKLFYSTNG